MSRNITTAFASIAGSRLLMLVASMAITPALLAFMGKGPYGQYASVMALFSMLMILVSAGIDGGVKKYLPEERDDPHWQDHVFAFYFRLAVGLAAVAAVVLVVAAYTGVVGVVMDPEYAPYFYLLAILVIAAQLRATSRRALMGMQLEHISEPLRVVNKVTFGIVAVTLAALGFGVQGVLAAFIVASMVVFGASMFYMGKHVSLSYILKPLPEEFPRWELFNFNHLSVAYVFFLTSMYHVDVLLLDVLTTGSGDAGLYKAALVLVQFLWFVPKSVQSVMVQSTSNLWAQGKTEKIESLASRVTRYSLLVTTLMALGLGALAADFVPLYYHADGVEKMTLPILLLLPGTLGFAVARPMLSINQAKGDMKVLIYATGAAAAINLGLNVLLIPRYGMIGAAIATSCGYGSLPLFQIYSARRLGYDPLADARVGRIAVTTLLAAVPIAALPLLLDNPFLTVLVVPPVGLVAYGLAAVATGAIDLDEMFDLLRALPDPIGSKATAVNRQLNTVGAGGLGFDSRRLFAVALPAVGVVFFVVALGVVAGVPGLPSLGSDDNPAQGPIVTTPTHTPGPNATNATNATPNRTAGAPNATTPTTAAGSTGGAQTDSPPPSTATATETPSPTTTEEDDGGWFDNPFDDDDDDGGDSSSTQTSTDTATPTSSPGSDTTTSPGTSTSTSTSTATTTSTPAQTTATPTASPTTTTQTTQSPTSSPSTTTTTSTTPAQTQTATATPTTATPTTTTATQTRTQTATTTAASTASATPDSTDSTDSTATSVSSTAAESTTESDTGSSSSTTEPTSSSTGSTLNS